jgi:tetratricopeptide (TPR) repeat protein
MKRILFITLMLATITVVAQKQQKPNINKALKSMQDGNLAEAKEMIDAATTYEKTMNDGKTWYYRGLIYASIDTSSVEAVSAFKADALKVALESFKKSDELGKKGSEYFTQEPGGIVPVTKTQQLEGLANHYLDRGIKAFQDDQDNEKSLELLRKSKNVFEKQLEKYANDTLTYYVTALVAQQADSADLALENAQRYLEKGGKSKDVYVIMYQIYNSGPKEDKEKALQVLRDAKKAVPNNPDFPKLEIGMLIDMGKIEEAQTGLEQEIKKDPNNKILHFYLGYTYDKVGNIDGARKSFQEALRIDPQYFEAQMYLANTYLTAVDKTSKELQNTGNTAKDSKRRSELVQQRVKESETAIPYLEKAEGMKATDKDAEIEVLQKLSLLYYYTADDKNSARVDKKMKALGVED